MKLTGAKIEGFLRMPDPKARAILVFGPDEGLVRERAGHLGKTVLDDLSDPFRVVELSANVLKEDPARLTDEAMAMAFGGGRRVVRVRQLGDAGAAACRSFLEHDHPPEALVVIEAGDLTPRSKLRKLFESAKNAVAIPCYADDARTLPDVIRQSLAQHGLDIERNAMALLEQSLGADRSVTRNELDKLALYMGSEKHVTETHVRAVIGDSAAMGLDDVIYATASGDTERLENTLARVLADGLNPVQIIRATQRHFQKLHMTLGNMANATPATQAMRALRPPIMFMRADAFRRQLTLWPLHKLSRAFDILIQAEIDCKTTGLPAAAITGRALLTLTRAARAGKR